MIGIQKGKKWVNIGTEKDILITIQRYASSPSWGFSPKCGWMSLYLGHWGAAFWFWHTKAKK